MPSISGFKPCRIYHFANISYVHTFQPAHTTQTTLMRKLRYLLVLNDVDVFFAIPRDPKHERQTFFIQLKIRLEGE